jgi:TonB family protein
MKKTIFSILFLLYAVQSPLASTNPAAQQLLINAEQQASLQHPPDGPLQLDLDFIAEIRVPTKGRLTLKWADDEHWWRRIVMGDFEQTDVRAGDKLYTSRNAPFTPVRVGELLSLFQFAEHTQGLQVKKEKQRLEGGVEMTCLDVEGWVARGKRRELCVSSSSHEILSEEWKEPPDERRREQYSEYFEFRGHRYPRKLKLFINGTNAITAQVDSLAATAFDPASLVAPKGAVERLQCADMKHAMPIKTPDPIYPKSSSQNKLMGDTTVAMTVLTDGSVSDIRLIGSATRAMDEATLQTLKSWRFKPAMCGTDPVVSDIEVVVSFRLQ